MGTWGAAAIAAGVYACQCGRILRRRYRAERQDAAALAAWKAVQPDGADRRCTQGIRPAIGFPF
jgi:hypothetical protein